MANIIGYVSKIDGVYLAKSQNGKIRVLQEGDPIYEDDTVYNGDGAQEIVISLNNGETLDLGSNTYIVFDNSVISDTPYATEDTNINIFRQVVNAIDYGHNKGVVHRDIKPSNVFLITMDVI